MLGGTGFDPGDLFEEVCKRAKDGRRHCPRDVPFMAFLIETMRSIAGHDRKLRSKTIQVVDEEELVDKDEMAPSDLSAYHTPEDRLIEQQAANKMKRMVQRVYDLLPHKPNAQHVIRGWLDSDKSEVREAIGQAEYDSAMKLIRTLMKRLYPGWKP
jgi:hypothetical protein